MRGYRGEQDQRLRSEFRNELTLLSVYFVWFAVPLRTLRLERFSHPRRPDIDVEDRWSRGEFDRRESQGRGRRENVGLRTGLRSWNSWLDRCEEFESQTSKHSLHSSITVGAEADTILLSFPSRNSGRFDRLRRSSLDRQSQEQY